MAFDKFSPTYKESNGLVQVSLKEGSGIMWEVPKDCIVDFYVSFSSAKAEREYALVAINNVNIGIVVVNFTTATQAPLEGAYKFLSKIPLLAGDIVTCRILDSSLVSNTSVKVIYDFNICGVLVS